MHDSGETKEPKAGYRGRHAIDTESPTVVMRADFDASGRLIGFGVGDEPALQDTYDRDKK